MTILNGFEWETHSELPFSMAVVVKLPEATANELLIPMDSLSLPQSVRELEQDAAVVNGKTLGS